MRIIESGKHKHKTLNECPVSYLKWLVSHERVLAVRNRWLSRDARFLLERMAKEQAAQEVAASKLGHMESLAKGGSFLAQMDLQMTKFIATNKIAEETVAAAPKYPVNKYGISDISMAGDLNGSSQGFKLLR